MLDTYCVIFNRFCFVENERRDQFDLLVVSMWSSCVCKVCCVFVWQVPDVNTSVVTHYH